MTRSIRRLILGALVFAIAVAIVAFASAQDGDRATAESILKELEASPKKEVAQEMIGRAKIALDRGARMRSAGDESHARIADSVAIHAITEVDRDEIHGLAIRAIAIFDLAFMPEP